MRKTLFRPEAMAAKNNQWLGEVVLPQPLMVRALSWLVVIVVAALGIFLFTGQYTRRVSASGILAPDAGLIKVQPPRDGVVVEKLVREGQQVRAGDILYVISSEVAYLPSGTQGVATGMVATKLDTLRARKDLLDEDATDRAEVAASERAEAVARVNTVQDELVQIDSEIAIQRERVNSKLTQFERNEQAHKQGFLSPLGLQQKFDDVLDQKARLQALLRARSGIERDLAAARTALASFDGKTRLTRSQLQREELDTARQKAEQEANGRIAVTAPTAGVVAAVLAEPGQRVSGQNLLTILPLHSRLEAQLLVPPSSIGFIRHGDRVELHFSAYPSLTNSRFVGEVAEVSRTTLATPELAEYGLAPVAGTARDARYRVRVRLPAQAITVSGAERPLRSGMEVDASFPQEQRRLVDWLLAPLLRFRENL